MTLSEQSNGAASLEQLFVSFARTILDQLNARIKTEGMPKRLHRIAYFSEDKSWAQFIEKNNYEGLITYIDSSFWNQEVVKQFVKKQWAAWQTSPMKGKFDQPFSSEPTDSLASQSLYQEYWFPVLDAIERYDTLQLTQEQLMESYSRYQKCWTMSSIQWDVIIPMTRFTCNLKKPVRISPHLQIAPFTPEEKASVWNQPMDAAHPVPVSNRAFLETYFKLIGSYIVERDRYVTQEVAMEVEDIITALRLVKAGDVGVLPFFESNQMPRSFTSSRFVSHPNDQIIQKPVSFYSLPFYSRQFGSLYRLSEADLPVVQRLSEALQKLDTQKCGLAVALRRFNQAYSRTIHEDRIIDLTIALESCLLADVSKEELNYRLALRGAALLSQTKLWESEQAYALLKAMYAIRSAIVHSGQQLSNLGKDQKKLLEKLGIPPDEFPELCEVLVRDILRTYVMWLIQGNRSVQTICDDLDRSILQGLTQSSSGEGGEAHEQC